MTNRTDFTLSGVLLLLLVGGVLAASVMALPHLAGEGALLTCFLLLGIWAVGAALLLVRPLFRDPAHTIWAILLLYMALCLRLVLFDHISPDYVSFLSQWTDTMEGMSIREALVTPIGDYNMPYLYLLLVISRLPLYDLYCIKLASVLADTAAALAVGKLAGLVTRRQGLVLGAFAAALLVPTAFLNSAYWGQCDSVYGAFALWGLYFGLRKRPMWSLSCFALAFAFKLQAVFLLPMVLFFLVLGWMKPKHLLVFPGVFLLTTVPALAAGRSFSDTFGIYFSQTGAYPYMTLNAPSAWALVPNDCFGEMEPAPVLLAGTAVLLLLYLYLRRRDRLTVGDLMDLALIFALAIPWLLPKMHERYFYLAEMLSILYAVRHPRGLAVAFVLLLGGFLVYRNYLFGGSTVLTLEQLSVAYGAVLCGLVYATVRQRPNPNDLKGALSYDKS